MTNCPFCHIPLDKSGKHFCTAIREPMQPQETKVSVFSCTECAYESGDKNDIVAHHKVQHPVQAHPPAKTELERIIEVLAWAHEKDALHFKCPYFEIIFPPKDPIWDDGKKAVHVDNAQAEAGLKDAAAVPMQNPMDDPDYYAGAQDRFYNHQRK